jgi:hypothetical protein
MCIVYLSLRMIAEYKSLDKNHILFNKFYTKYVRVARILD